MFSRLALALAWLACAIGVAIHAFAPVDDVEGAVRSKTSSVSCPACALVARDVTLVARYARRDAREDELDGSNDEVGARYEVLHRRGDSTIGSRRDD
jgi:hypothetical protein